MKLFAIFFALLGLATVNATGMATAAINPTPTTAFCGLGPCPKNDDAGMSLVQIVRDHRDWS
jgi:hypothetical protein